MTRLLILLLLGSSLSACRGQKSAQQALGGAEVYRVIAEATQISAHRMHVTFTPVDGDSHGGKKMEVSEDPQAVPLTVPLVTALRELLLSDATYRAELKFCAFRPTVKYRFGTAHNKVDIVLCFACGDLETSLDGKNVEFAPFDPAYEQLLDISKAVFPDDQKIQNLDPMKFKHKGT